MHRKPDGTPPDLPRRADLLVYEVFDSGCIGEGVLHLLAAAQAKLLASDAALVPLSARVYCQPIQMRLGQVLGFDCSQANRWRWRPDYEGVELGRCRWAGWPDLAGRGRLHTVSCTCLCSADLFSTGQACGAKYQDSHAPAVPAGISGCRWLSLWRPSSLTSRMQQHTCSQRRRR